MFPRRPAALYRKQVTMAKFASRFGKYRHGVRNAKTTVVGQDSQGNKIEQVRVAELMAVFQPAPFVLTPSEVSLALKNLKFKGLPIDRDTEEHMSPLTLGRLSALDTLEAQYRLGWSDEERELVEQELRDSHHLGTDHIEIEPEPAVRPWPTFDTDDIETVVSVARITGQVQVALAYERENQARPELIEALSSDPEEEKATVIDAS